MVLEVKHEVLKSANGLIVYKKFSPNGHDHYRLRVYIEGTNLEINQVRAVEYELHPTFPSPHLRTSTNKDDNFALKIWTWGEFEIPVTIHLKNERKISLIHNLQYSDLLPPEDHCYLDMSN